MDPGLAGSRRMGGGQGGQGPVREGKPEEWMDQTACLCWLSKELGFILATAGATAGFLSRGMT